LWIGVLAQDTLELQNYVPNASFEENQNIPCNLIFKTATFNKAMQAWHCPTNGTADIWSMKIDPSCTNFALGNQTYSTFSIRKPVIGGIMPYSGNTMIGLAAFLLRSNYREYVQIKLLKPLQKDQQYKVSFWAARGSSTMYASNGLGVALLTQPISIAIDKALTQIQPQVYSQKILEETTWQKIEGIFTATDTLSYLIIGNFFNNQQTQFIEKQTITDKELQETACAAYYFIDDITLQIYDSTAIDNENLFAGFKNSQSITALPNENIGFTLSDTEIAEEANETKEQVVEITTNKLLQWENYFFEGETDILSQKGKTTLAQLTDTLQNNEYQLQIYLHALVEDEKTSLKITEKRAKVLVKYFSQQGIDKKRIIYECFGANILQYGESKIRERVDFFIK
jgi:outer membrane protein OmpA-like peptidoglycan-associated protein